VNAWKIILATLVIFVAGIITGASLVKFAQNRGGRMNPRPQPEMNQLNNPVRPENPNRRNDPEFGNQPSQQPGQQPGLLNRQFVLGLDRQLKLTREQREKVEKLMVEGQERIRQMRSKLEPEMRKEMHSVNEQIKTLLTPEQREQFERIMKQRFPLRAEQPNQPDRRFREPREPRGGQNDFREPLGEQPPPRSPEGGEPPQNP
jgi:Spy/CpxP family protein refolding chaperone